jgi:YkoY family integral membrane protein
MFGQTFQLADLAGVGALVVLEALLSADNALVLAIMVRHLPKDEQRKALLYGLAGAFIFRFMAILFAAIVLKQWWLQGLGAVYLLWVPLKHFYSHSRQKEVKPVGAGFWQTVIAVELTDIAFAVDSILAGVTFIDNKQEKIWVVYFGAIIGIVLLRFAASLFIRLLEKYPFLDHVAYLLVGWVGVKLAFLTGHTYEKYNPGQLSFNIPEMPTMVFWGVLLAIGIIGTIIAVKRGADFEHVPDDCDETFDEAMQPEKSKSPSDVS